MNQTKKHYPFFRSVFLIAIGATLAAFVCKLLLMQYYVIPSGSMFKTILVGDGILVSKLHYGPIVFDRRLPGISSIKRSDIVVFNDPSIEGQFLIKRLIGLPGDSLLIRHQQVFVNRIRLNDPPKSMSKFFIQTESRRELDKMITNGKLEILNQTDSNTAFVCITAEDVDSLKSYQKGRVKLTAVNTTTDDQNIFPLGSNFNWNKDNFGVVRVPKKGNKVSILPANYLLYKKIIEEETGKSVKLVNNKVLLEDMLLTEFIFRKNYYFMLGDNRNNSKDSRYFGFVAYDQIIGRALVRISLHSKKPLVINFL